MLTMLYSQSRNQRCLPSDLIACSDPVAAYVLNRAVWAFGAFIENETQRFQMASKEDGKKTKRPSEGEVAEYRRALMEGTPYSRKNARSKAKKMSLADYARRGGSGGGQGRKIVQERGGKMRVE